MKIWVLIFLGGGIGSICRFLFSRWITGTIISSFPCGTFIVNLTGCFLIGFSVFYFSESRFGMATAPWRLFFVTGICGGYTTFSAFSIENVNLLENQQFVTFLTYTFGSLILGLLATFAGIILARNI